MLNHSCAALPYLPAALSGENLTAFPDHLRAELLDRGGNYPMRVVWARNSEQ